jgi:hypothetical protein
MGAMNHHCRKLIAPALCSLFFFSLFFLMLLIAGWRIEQAGPDPQPSAPRAPATRELVQREPMQGGDSDDIMIEQPPRTEEQLLEEQINREAGSAYAKAMRFRLSAIDASEAGNTEFAAELRPACIDLLNEIIEDYPDSRFALRAKATLRWRVYRDRDLPSRYPPPPKD